MGSIKTLSGEKIFVESGYRRRKPMAEISDFGKYIGIKNDDYGLAEKFGNDREQIIEEECVDASEKLRVSKKFGNGEIKYRTIGLINNTLYAIKQVENGKEPMAAFGSRLDFQK